jgi:hypothetical protein
MSRDDEFDGLVDMVDVDDFDAANKRTVGLVDLFAEVVRWGIMYYPQDDLHNVLETQAVVFAQCAVARDLIKFDDIGNFFKTCGFDRKRVQVMVRDYYWLFTDEKPLEPALAEEVEVYREWSKRK